ncbi:hypothetical protein GGU10DRAFT_337582 [Lentinula aff. detonsa]|uniref:Uncharacterized protein n=1 Tax=Lentinula aff. detonsa TaxID=2804958 RepID=A0AA38NB24_9AGAR|nr:hypothetical protein GGU10DRAFT_337582 [Lentinula aff. detonsa]
MCSFAVNVVKRWLKYHKDDADLVQNAHWAIPMCMAHFHSETAEYAWAIFNGPLVLQMSIGYRIDTLIIHYGNWNWRKVVGLAQQLLKDLNKAKVIEWNSLDRSPRVDPKSRRTVVSIYSHNNEKAPTLKAIVDKEMSSSEMIAVSTGNIKLGAVASWLMEGFQLLQLQNHIKKLARTPPSTKKKYMGSIASQITQQPDERCPEDQHLLLLSDFTASERQKLRLLPLATKETQMLEAALGETISNLQTMVKNLSAAFERKIKDARGQDANTKSITQIRKIESKRNDLMGDYNLFRGALKALDNLDEAVQDIPGALSGYDVDEDEEGGEGDEPKFATETLKYQGTQMSMRQVQPVKLSPSKAFEDGPDILEHAEQPGVDADGWIWSAGRLKNMSLKEVEIWEDTNNRIQWFQVEAKFERWQEQVETKHAEFPRMIKSSAYSRDAWLKLAQEPHSSSLGHVAYAKEHSNMWESLQRDAEAKFKHCGIPRLQIIPKGKTLANNVLQWKQEEEKHFNFNR